MGITTKRLWPAAALLAGALALAACSAQAEEPAEADTTQSATAAPAAAETQSGPEAVPFGPSGLEMVDKSDIGLVQMNIAQNWIGKVATHPYGLSGQWTLDGNDSANTAKLWANYFSDDLQAKLAAAGVNGDVTGFGAWSLMALAPPESSDPIKASPACTMDYDNCRIGATSADGSISIQEGFRFETMDLSVPNRVAVDYDIIVPVSLTEHDNAEGILRGLLKADITFVENPTPDDGRPPYLIDKINNELLDAQADLASNSPELSFMGTTNPIK